MTDKTPEQIAAEKAAAAEAKAAAKAEKVAKAAEAKAQKAAEREAKKGEAKAAKEAAVAQKKADKEAKAAAVKAAKEANRQPEQNGVRRPKPDGQCGKAWAIFDSVSQKNGAPASIAESLVIANSQGLNEGNVKAEYARWRKFNGVTGRVAAPAKEEAAATA